MTPKWRSHRASNENRMHKTKCNILSPTPRHQIFADVHNRMVKKKSDSELEK